MFSRAISWAALAALGLASAGCQSAINCGSGCRSGCSHAFQTYDCSCDGACGPCAGGCGEDRCPDPGCGFQITRCGDACGGRQPRPIDRLLGCTGCGELYFYEWHNDPPAQCEPCDCLGNYTGPGSAWYYRAPYRRDAGYGNAPPSSLPPLELADSEKPF